MDANTEVKTVKRVLGGSYPPLGLGSDCVIVEKKQTTIFFFSYGSGLSLKDWEVDSSVNSFLGVSIYAHSFPD